MTIAIFARVLLALGVAGGCTLASRSLIHLFQLESYQFPGYRRSVLRAWRRSVAPGLMMTVLSVALLAAHRTLDMHASEGVQLFLALAVLAVLIQGIVLAVIPDALIDNPDLSLSEFGNVAF